MPSSFIASKDELLDVNDPWQEFIDNRLEITDDVSDKLTKSEVHDLVQHFMKNKEK